MTEYTLPNLSTIVGTFKFTLYSDFAGLTVPTDQTIVEVGELTETSDIQLGVAQLSTLRLTLIDDYTNYTYGFWYKVLSGETRLRVYLDQYGTDTFYFFGVVQGDTVQWSEEYISGTTRLRTVTFELVDVSMVIMDTPTTDWVDAVIANAIDQGSTTNLEPNFFIKPAGLFAAMLSASGLNASYNIADVSYVWNSGPDFIWLDGVTEYRFDQVYIPVKYYSAALPGNLTTNYFTHSQPSNQGLENYYPKLRKLMGDLARNFGLVVRMSYDTSTERHLIQLIQRGRAYSATLDFNSEEKQSDISKSFDLIGDAVKCSDLMNPTTVFCWFSKRFSDGPTTSEPPDYVDFDANNPAPFTINTAATQAGLNHSIYVWDGVSLHVYSAISGVKYYNYNTDANVTATATGAKAQEAVAGYYYHRFTNEYSKITRRYQLFGVEGLDHTSLNILKRTTINDGLASSVYYANRVTKKPAEHEVEIEWFLE